MYVAVILLFSLSSFFLLVNVLMASQPRLLIIDLDPIDMAYARRWRPVGRERRKGRKGEKRGKKERRREAHGVVEER